VADRGNTAAADAIQALAEAIQRDPELADDRRAELLDNVADVADAVADPVAPRKLSRAKAAMNAITSAASVSSHLAQTVGNWHDILNKLF
jgi:hypothetical protein